MMTKVWAKLILCDEDRDRIRSFLTSRCGIKPRFIVKQMHITVYHARRQMPGVHPSSEHMRVTVPTSETRLMVFALGGENPRPEIDPARRGVGIRVQKKNVARSTILTLREKLLRHENLSVLGTRRPSTLNRSAFGARYFQPHMAILRAGSGVDRDLTKLGIQFRESIDVLHFNRFEIDVTSEPQRPKGPTMT
jgi:hypothetical protein